MKSAQGSLFVPKTYFLVVIVSEFLDVKTLLRRGITDFSLGVTENPNFQLVIMKKAKF